MAAERRAKRARRLVAAGVVLVIAFLGFAGGWIGHGLFHQQTFIARSFVEDAAAAHKVFTVETRHPIEVTALGSGRLLSSRSGAPAAMLMYQDAEGIGRRSISHETEGRSRHHFGSFLRMKGVLNLYTGLIATQAMA